MTRKWRWTILGIAAGLYLLGLAFLGGLLAERVRFDHDRTAVLTRYDRAVRHWQAHRIRLEQSASAGRETATGPWVIHLQRADEALANKNVRAAELAWHDAYVEALRSRRWEGLVEVGDAYLRIGEVARGQTPAKAKARRAYLTALFRARQQGSLDGVLRATEAFAALGDREVAEQGVYIAERLAASARDPETRERVAAVGEWQGEVP